MWGSKGDALQRWPELGPVLEGIPWAIVGAVATRRYMPERATRDLDIVILPSDRELVERRLTEAGYTRQGPLTIGGSAWRAPRGTPVDVIEGLEAWWPSALREAAANADAEGAPILPAPYLIMMKLLASRVQDLADVTRILGGLEEDALDRVRALMRQHAPDLTEDLESLIILGRLERPE